MRKLSDVPLHLSEQYYSPNYCLWLEGVVEDITGDQPDQIYEEYTIDRVRAKAANKQANT